MHPCLCSGDRGQSRGRTRREGRSTRSQPRIYGTGQDKGPRRPRCPSSLFQIVKPIADAIVVQNLTHTYPPSRASKTARKALNGVSFSVHSGEIFGLLGPNGGGKTTIFHILSTVFPPTEGKALIFGLDVAQQPARVRQR